MPKLPCDSELLLPFEIESVKGDYKEYYKTRKNNFFASIQRFRGLWRAFLDLDELFVYEFKAMNEMRDPNQPIPALLLLNSHAQTRLAVEFGFCCCPNEGIGLMRNAIESAAFALKMVREPATALIWASKDDGPDELEAFKNHFERNKKQNLFPAGYGLEKLHTYWGDYSETGSHTTPSSLGYRFEKAETQSGEDWKVIYTGVDEQKSVVSIISLIDASAEIEKVVFYVFRTRLQFDVQLLRLRESFHRRWIKAAKAILTKMGLAPIIQP